MTVSLFQPSGLPSTGGLPGPLAGPLQFHDPALARWPILALLLAAALWALFRWWHRRQTPEPAPQTPTGGDRERRPRPPRAPTLGQILGDLRERYLASREYRAGCHELSGLLKSHYEATGGRRGKPLPWTRMTAREIRRTIGGTAISSFLIQLADLRFGRARPSRQDFKRVCRRAEQVVASDRRKSLRLPPSVPPDDEEPGGA